MDFLGVNAQLLGGFKYTLLIFFITLVAAIPLGLPIALGSMSRFKPLRWISRAFVWVIRGTPLMLQIFAIYFAIPTLTGVNLDRMNATILSFSLNYAAYFAEIFRGGIESIPRGQYEAAAALGMTKAQTFFRIILPQVIKRIVPASSNEVITLVKDTSLANVVAYSEIMLAAKQQMMNYSSLVPLFIAGVFYFVMATVLTALFGFIEKKLNYYR